MKPKIFIGSSVETRKIAYAIQENLEYDAECTVWTQGVFELSTTALSSLIRQVHLTDFAIFVFGPDDVTQIRKQEKSTVRDNVIFETGLFIGGIGVERVYFVSPSDNSDLHLPSDLLGISSGRYDSSRQDYTAALGTFSNQVRKKIEELGFLRNHVVKEDNIQNSSVPEKGFEYTDSHVALDRAVYLKIKVYLPIGGSIQFIRDNNFSGSFKREHINDLKNFHYEGDNPELEFVNPELEGIRVELSNSIERFLYLIAKNTWAESDTAYASIPQEWEETNPGRYQRVLDSIHQTCNDICKAYDQLIRRSKIILAV